MLFNSWQFALFFPVVFFLYWFLPHRFRIYILLISSYYFYMSWNTRYVVLILFTTIISYLASILIERFKIYGKLILMTSLILCLGVLFIFKYFNFISQSLADFLKLFAIPVHPMTLTLMLPVGISFYTFQTLSYIIDVYRGTIKPEHNFIVYAVFVSFFPQLVAGPIERTNNLLPQIKARHEFNYEQGTYGLKLIAWGLFKKIAIADFIAAGIDKVYGNITHYRGFVLVLATFFFMIQIYCDFSGYSDIARGCAKMMGIELMENFKSPYFSSSLHEFWSRWHISLSTWFRDYVYIPLGGNRRRHYLNLMLTFMVSGLWHGANWTFVVWGAVHGVGQVLEDVLGLKGKRSFWGWIVVFAFTGAAWVLFRAQSLHDAMYVFRYSFEGITRIQSYLLEGIKNAKTVQYGLRKILWMISVLALYDYCSRKEDAVARINRAHFAIRWTIYAAFMVYLTWPSEYKPSEFIYFQF